MNGDRDKRQSARLSLIAGIAALVAIAYSPSYAAMLELWQQADHHHGLLVFPIVGYLLWRVRGSVAAAVLRPWAWGIPLLAVLVGLWMLSRAVGVQAAEHLAAVLMIPASVAIFLGIDLMRRVLFPMMLLTAAVPIADLLVPGLMRVTADVSEGLLRAAGVPVYREGQFMTLPGGQFEVADVCSGLRYLSSGTIIALLFGYLTYRSYLKRIWFVVAAALVLVAANGVRAFTVMFVASMTEMRYLGGRDHLYFGWLLFGIVIVALLWVGARYADTDQLTRHEEGRSKAGVDRWGLLPLVLVLAFAMLAVTARPFEAELGTAGSLLLLASAALLLSLILHRRLAGVSAETAGAGLDARSYYTRAAGVVTCVAGVVLLVGPLQLADATRISPPRYHALELPILEGCRFRGDWELDWRPVFRQPDFSGAASYHCRDAAVHAFVAGYSVDLQGRELISEANRIVPDEWRRYSERATHRLASEGSGPPEVVEIRVEGPAGGGLLVWYWYSIGDRTSVSPIGVKLLQAYRQIALGRTEGAVYLLATTLDRDLDASRRRLAPAAVDLAAVEHDLLSASADTHATTIK